MSEEIFPPLTPIDSVEVVRVSLGDVVRRMQAGEKLRWVPCSMLNVKARCRSQRMLMLGDDVLDEESGLEVVAAERKNVFACDNQFVSEYSIR